MKQLLTAMAMAMAFSAGLTGPARADYVCNLNPNGDNFLSLRQGPGTGYPEIIRMNPGTQLTVRGGSGPWLNVEITLDGIVGWAYSQYVCQ